MKKTLTCLLFSLAIIFAFALNSLAAINSTGDIYNKINKLQQLANTDFNSFVNKSELIGNLLQSYNMLTSQYQNEAILAQESLRTIAGQINVIYNSADIPDSEKQMQINKLYQEADNVVFEMNSKSIQYLYSLKRFMPTITYQKYAKKFRTFYNDLNLTETKIISK